MFVPSVSGVQLTPTSTAAAGPGVVNSMAITTTNNSTFNTLTMFLFFFFLCSTVVLVIASVVFLRRIKKRDANTASKACNKKDGKLAFVMGRDIDEESSMDGPTVELAQVERTLSGSTKAGSK
ncbi:hypothetical protein SEPCBS57363_005613 [Sporothrix epigloea]|uniref:Transmembrane protein n=1 Tax=Sporothrix epigloea TaxID=1892477 RepID=A0ABP0DZQ9_9PEZI